MITYKHPNKMNALLPFLVFIMLFMSSCGNKPKVIESVESEPETQQPMIDESANLLHKVVAKEILHTSRYTYMNVEEDGSTFWIAIPRKEVAVGTTYYYRGGLKKNNFKSVEHDRVFETVYLVSDVSTDPNMIGMAVGNPHADMPVQTEGGKIDPPPGGIRLSELMDNKEKYDGKTVRVKGRVIKLNNMIMNRNWIHINDGSLKDETIDLTITTTENVPLGAVVAFEGVITLNKDFGAGYKYEIIMENAQLLQ
jgi:hypothetical protein